MRGRGWITISVGSDDEWAAFSRVAQSQPWAAGAPIGRWKAALPETMELGKQVRAWARNRECSRADENAYGASVCAGVVRPRRISSRRTSRSLHTRRLRDGRSRGDGAGRLQRQPVHPVGTPARLRSAPLIGEHNDKVFGDWAGIPDDERARLEGSRHLRLNIQWCERKRAWQATARGTQDRSLANVAAVVGIGHTDWRADYRAVRGGGKPFDCWLRRAVALTTRPGRLRLVPDGHRRPDPSRPTTSPSARRAITA